MGSSPGTTSGLRGSFFRPLILSCSLAREIQLSEMKSVSIPRECLFYLFDISIHRLRIPFSDLLPRPLLSVPAVLSSEFGVRI